MNSTVLFAKGPKTTCRIVFTEVLFVVVKNYPKCVLMEN